ncbi:RnfABCDGE type electron transport complex subunit B [candidate division KSB1 bacterium]|nr:RnfABCDGE type electron transport complex subunit B [candidate division KSB1 bacterium]
MDFSLLSALIVLGGLGLLFGAGLAVASRAFAVFKDPRVERVEEALPGANCGACGAPGCAGFAEGVVDGNYPVSGCTVGGAEVTEAVALIMGTEAGDVSSCVAVVNCRGDKEACPDRAIYHGIQDCRAAMLVDDGSKGCVYGCLGLGTCVAACPFNAMIMSENGLPVVIEALCTGCGECVKACPRDIMQLMPTDQIVFMGCKSQDFGKAVKSVCKVGCIGCSLCANPKTTAEGLITMEGKLPKIHYDLVKDPWGDLENAVNKCPTKSFGIRGKVPEPLVKEEEFPVT